jgi:hypothetical protein
MTLIVVVALPCLITTAPLLIAVAAAVFFSNPLRRCDARCVVRLLRIKQLSPHETAPTTEEQRGCRVQKRSCLTRSRSTWSARSASEDERC